MRLTSSSRTRLDDLHCRRKMLAAPRDQLRLAVGDDDLRRLDSEVDGAAGKMNAAAFSGNCWANCWRAHSASSVPKRYIRNCSRRCDRKVSASYHFATRPAALAPPRVSRTTHAALCSSRTWKRSSTSRTSATSLSASVCMSAPFDECRDHQNAGFQTIWRPIASALSRRKASACASVQSGRQCTDILRIDFCADA